MKGSASSLFFPMASVVLAAACVLLALRAGATADRLQSERDSLAECKRIVSKISAAKLAPETASGTQQPEEELSRRIESWAKQAGVGPRQMIRIDPVSPRRAGDSDYLVQGHEVELASLSLPHLAQFAAVVRRDDARLRVSRLRLSPSRTPGSESEGWQAEIALTYLLHSPKSPRRTQ